MAKNAYEGMFILDSGRYGRDPEAVPSRISQMIQEAGGEMLVSRLWEERRLAYPIKGHRRGTYWLTYFRLDSSRLAQIERQCQLDENILRKLFMKIDQRIVDTLVDHAQAASGPTTRESKDQEAPRTRTGLDEGANGTANDDVTAKDSEESDLSEVTDQKDT